MSVFVYFIVEIVTFDVCKYFVHFFFNFAEAYHFICSRFYIILLVRAPLSSLSFISWWFEFFVCVLTVQFERRGDTDHLACSYFVTWLKWHVRLGPTMECWLFNHFILTALWRKRLVHYRQLLASYLLRYGINRFASNIH